MDAYEKIRINAKLFPYVAKVSNFLIILLFSSTFLRAMQLNLKIKRSNYRNKLWKQQKTN